MKVDACFEDIKNSVDQDGSRGKGKWLSRGFANFLFADDPPRTAMPRLDEGALQLLPSVPGYN